VASRGYAEALWRLPFDVNLHAIRKPFHNHARTAEQTDVVTFSGAPDLVLINLNPDAWSALLDPSHHEIMAGARRRAGLWVWEMSHVPESWFPMFLEQDAVLTTSHYCAEVFERAGASPVGVIPHVVEVDPAPIRGLDATGVREQLGVPRQARVVLYAFDGASYLVRKNPEALVAAFKASGLGSRGWVLILKTKNLYDNAEEGSRLAALVGDDPAIRLINKSLNRQDMSALFWTADVYASSHRSEGFGLTVAEAMAAGKVVVATDFGGTRDVLDASCGFPVKAATVKLDGDFGHYTRGGEWAEVDPDALTRALASAAEEVEFGRLGLGQRASRRIQEQLSVSAVAKVMQASIEGVMAQSR
jgi:glycosyltransferase involved in cell wall biosynthesis